MVRAWREGHDLSFVQLPDHCRESEARVGENWVLYWENGILVQGPRQFAPRQVLQSALGGPVPARIPHTGCPLGKPAAENPRILAHTATETAQTCPRKRRAGQVPGGGSRCHVGLNLLAVPLGLSFPGSEVTLTGDALVGHRPEPFVHVCQDSRREAQVQEEARGLPPSKD